jgi:hypothetical protein
MNEEFHCQRILSEVMKTGKSVHGFMLQYAPITKCDRGILKLRNGYFKGSELA